MIISHAVQHRVQHHLRIPGPRGVLARQIVEMGELLEMVQLDKVVNQLSRALQERSLQEVESRSPTLGDISSRARTGENIIQPDGTSDTEVIADDTNFNGWTTTHARLETSQTCGRFPRTWTSTRRHRSAIATEMLLCGSPRRRNPDRLFWKCGRERSQQCSFFQWLTTSLSVQIFKATRTWNISPRRSSKIYALTSGLRKKDPTGSTATQGRTH